MQKDEKLVSFNDAVSTIMGQIMAGNGTNPARMTELINKNIPLSRSQMHRYLNGVAVPFYVVQHFCICSSISLNGFMAEVEKHLKKDETLQDDKNPIKPEENISSDGPTLDIPSIKNFLKNVIGKSNDVTPPFVVTTGFERAGSYPFDDWILGQKDSRTLRTYHLNQSDGQVRHGELEFKRVGMDTCYVTLRLGKLSNGKKIVGVSASKEVKVLEGFAVIVNPGRGGAGTTVWAFLKSTDADAGSFASISFKIVPNKGWVARVADVLMLRSGSETDNTMQPETLKMLIVDKLLSKEEVSEKFSWGLNISEARIVLHEEDLQSAIDYFYAKLYGGNKELTKEQKIVERDLKINFKFNDDDTEEYKAALSLLTSIEQSNARNSYAVSYFDKSTADSDRHIDVLMKNPKLMGWIKAKSRADISYFEQMNNQVSMDSVAHNIFYKDNKAED